MPAQAATAERRITAEDNRRLSEWAASCYYDPERFIDTAYPWGKKGTTLVNKDGPDVWQRDVCRDIRDKLLEQADEPDNLALQTAIRVAVSSGHGIGKTALIAWIVHWFMTTRPHPQIVVTANTEPQLRTKTWRELAKWWKLSIHDHWFLWTATQFKFLGAPNTWFATALPWSEHNSEAFAGTHEEHVLLLFDEASKIADIIWEVAEGALTTPGAIWIAFGNPTLNTGRFRQCFTKFRDRWLTRKIDSRTAKMANNAQIAEWKEDYGEDSDFFRVRVRGEFPRAGPLQLIPVDLVEEAQGRTVELEHIPRTEARVMGVDVARGGLNKTVIIRRVGRKMLPEIIRLDVRDLMVIADKVAEQIDGWNPDHVMVDATGLGAGVYDRLIQLGYDQVLAVESGNRKHVQTTNVYFNPRIEMWDRMKKWLATADIPGDYDLYEDLIGPEYFFDSNHLMRLESKEDMLKRGIPSPDLGDALALTHSQLINVRRGDEHGGRNSAEPDIE